jgi:hypothetical protein
LKPLALVAIYSGVVGFAGALLLLQPPAEVFNGVVPILIILSSILVVVGTRLEQAIAARPAKKSRTSHVVALYATLWLTGAYGGYFGKAQGAIFVIRTLYPFARKPPAPMLTKTF